MGIDQGRSSTAGINTIFKRLGISAKITTVQSKYLNNIFEQDHRFIKRGMRPMLGSKSFELAAAAMGGIAVTHMVRKGQLGSANSGSRQFAELAG